MIAAKALTPQEQGERVVRRLRELGVRCSLSRVVAAPQVIRVELRPEDGELMRNFRRLDRPDDLAWALSAPTVRIEAPIPGRDVVGVEIGRPAYEREVVSLIELPPASYPLRAPIGLDVDGSPAVLDLATAPHALVAGSTGSGKSTLLHAVLAQLTRSHDPTQLELVLVDVKRVELTRWEHVPHLAAPIAEDAQEALHQLRVAVACMERRYESMRACGVSDVEDFNRANPARPIPRVVVVVDELAELMMTSRKEAEGLLVRLAQKGRASGIHLLLATQYPLVSVLTGLLKANIPTRIALALPSMTASRVVLDKGGAESLLGLGDGLLSVGGYPPIRFQGASVSGEDIQAVTNDATRQLDAD